jgi:natural product precursor
MKAKRFNRKLALNKKTIANLNFNEMSVVFGGGLTDDCTTDCTQQESICPHLCPPTVKSMPDC